MIEGLTPGSYLVNSEGALPGGSLDARLRGTKETADVRFRELIGGAIFRNANKVFNAQLGRAHSHSIVGAGCRGMKMLPLVTCAKSKIGATQLFESNLIRSSKSYRFREFDG